ncbi:putative ATP-grasp-modified RiPP [Streptomyces sp. NPDC050433]|uniref:putative ATP-grasp-modified RiPP n=1 Tax=Streptomyces sp. NPDC050433 TaxID=3365615 RepID=UPI0037A786B6
MLNETQESAVPDLPWGLTRMRPFPPGEPFPCTTIVLNPETQMGQWLDEDGVPVPMGGKHQKPSTARETKPKTSLDGNADEGTDQETD